MQSIRESIRLFKRKFSHLPLDVVIVAVVCLVGVGSFALGWLAHATNTTNNIQVREIDLPVQSAAAGAASDSSSQKQESGVLVGSKNSDIYHYRWCSGAQRINEENKVYFSDRAQAREAGYTAAQNCPGLTTEE